MVHRLPGAKIGTLARVFHEGGTDRPPPALDPRAESMVAEALGPRLDWRGHGAPAQTRAAT